MQLLWSNMYPQSELDNYKLQVDLLQEKLKQSEENRQQLQKELQQILQRRSEHDKSVRTKIRQKYQSFLDEQERRNERNKILMQMIERIDQQTAALSARSERLKMMKLQYERYFSKLMQAPPVRCIPNAVPTTKMTTETTPLAAMTGPTQIPVLLPTTAPSVGSLSGVKSEVTGAKMPAAAAVQPAAGHLEAMTGMQSAALTPHLWTLAMATPTPAGLLFSGAPTAAMAGGHGALPTTPAPFEFLQYPLGYGPIIQQQPLHQQIKYPTATPTGPSATFGNQSDIPQGYNTYLSEKKLSVSNKYGLTDNTVPTAEAATSTEFPSILEKSTKQTETMPNSISSMEESTEIEGSIQATTLDDPTPLTSTQSLDKLPRHQSEYITSIKASINTPADAFREPNSAINEVISGVSAVKLEDADIIDDEMSPTEPTVSSTEPKMCAISSYNPEEDNNKSTSDDEWKKGNVINLSTAEEHRRKIAEIERRYGPIDTDLNYDNASRNMDVDSNETFIGFKRFSEIVNPKNEASTEELATANENLDTQSWQSHTGSVEKAATVLTSNPISNSKIDNIENAIYGELVNPQLPETEETTTRTTAQGFFTELLEQQETPLENNKMLEIKPQEQKCTTKSEMEKSNLSEDAEYANYNPTSESDNAGDLNTKNAVNEPTNPQNQTTYGTSNQELSQPMQTFTAETAFATSETPKSYAEYSTEQKIDTNFTDSTADQQQQEQQQNYSQQEYENYDATQYDNYDPNTYPGYIYDETTGQYVVDPQYVAPDAGDAAAIYSAQEYIAPQEQQQLQIEYPTDQVQEASYTYEDQAPTTTEQTVLLDSAVTTTEVADLTTSPPATVEPPVAQASKVVKPTSILSTAEKHALQNDVQKKKKRVNFVDSSETDDSSSVKAPGAGAAAAAAGGESDFDFSSGAETSMG